MEINGVSQVTKYFPLFNDRQKEQLRQLSALYNHWNQKINLISRKDLPHLYEKHVLHSLTILEHLPQQDSSEVADVGTGGGFPGIPLAIACPHLHFHLIDSVGKKIKALQAIKDALELSNVSLHKSRMEEIQLPIEIVVCRAVAKTDQILKWTKKLSSTDNLSELYLLKGGDMTTELRNIKGWKVQIETLNTKYDEDFFESKVLIHLSVVRPKVM